MKRYRAEELEEAIERVARGEPVGEGSPYVDTIRQVQKLAAPVPPPPHNLVPGRQRLLAEAARRRTGKTGQRQEGRRMSGAMRLATAFIALILVSGLVFGAGQAMAASLPGDPLYGVKLAVEGWQQALTRDPLARAGLDLSLAETRMDEVTALLEQNKSVDEAVTARVQQQLEVALGSAAQEPDQVAAGTLQQLALAIQQRQQTMERLLGESPQAAVRQLIRVMEQVRQEAHLGAGDPAGLRQRLRQGTPTAPGVVPGPSHTPLPAGPQGPQPMVTPDAGPGPGPQPAMTSDAGPGPGPQPAMTSDAGPGPGPQPAMTSDAGPGPGPQPAMTSDAGPGPGPQPTMTSDAGPGPGPQPAVTPGPDPDPQPTAKRGSGSGSGGGQKP